ncbi:hypothetical protein K0M31_017312 [Melipona bicolor]|uniref:Uncharacterized protein n=1 Tax=Melipona bicolor TaxID=60889 RepID=A0AA40KSB3_9HYME|nr:hypothetical protein K0M31_017312 [Melipona bicolor]
MLVYALHTLYTYERYWIKMLLRLKKYVLHSQIRQFITFHMNNTTQMKMKTTQYCRELKNSNLINASFNIHRLFFTENQNQNLLPPLMTKVVPKDNLLKIFWTYHYIRRTIDHEFNNQIIMQGVKQAIFVISEALSKQNYEALDGIVSPKAITVLRHRVNRLTPSQLELLNINPDFLGFFTRSLSAKRMKDSTNAIVEVAIHGMTMMGIPVERQSYIYFCYVFQRKYKDGMGGPWIVKLVNHTSMLI